MAGMFRRLLSPESVVRDHLMHRNCLSVVCEFSLIKIAITDQQLANPRGYQEIASSLRNFSPVIERWKPYSWLERRYIADQVAVKRGFPVWTKPLVYNRHDKFQDVAAFDALYKKFGLRVSAVSLTELAKDAESAFVETRPADFNWRSYYA